MSGARVLVVDDTQVNLVLLSGILQAAGYDVRIANSAARAMKALERQVADAVLLDVEMPETDGFELCRMMRQSPALAEVPVLFLSGHDDPAVRARAFAAGGVDYVVKPFEAEEVLARVSTQLERRRGLDIGARLLAAVASHLRGSVLDGAWRVDGSLGPRAGLHRVAGTAVADDMAVVIHLLPPTEEALRVLGGQAPDLVAFRHPAVVPTLAAGVADGVPWVVTPAGTVGASLSAPADEVRDGLEAAHAVGLVHGHVDRAHLERDAAGIVRLAGLGLAPLVSLRALVPDDDLRALERLIGGSQA